MRRTVATSFAASILASGAFASAAAAAGPPPAPTSPAGLTVHQVATGLSTPTSFAWGHRAMFAADGTQSQSNPTDLTGGVYQLKHGHARKLRDSVVWASGLAFHKGVLYVSAVTKTKSGKLKSQILAWRHWNGKNFTKRRAIYTAPAGYQGFNGLAFGPNGRIYVGSDVGLFNGNDHGPATTSPYLYDILSMNTRGRNRKVFAQGIRQPWQMTFPGGSSSPIVTDLGANTMPSNPNPPDLLLKVSAGNNFGFPTCDWTQTGAGKGKGHPPKFSNKCKPFTPPLTWLAPHTDPGGIGTIGSTLYFSEFGFAAAHGGPPPAVASLPVSGKGTPKQLITGAVPIIGLNVHRGSVYFGDLAGRVYRFKP
jgi:glucose/arabinose dehydrogenase